jgi:hypothetical protein
MAPHELGRAGPLRMMTYSVHRCREQMHILQTVMHPWLCTVTVANVPCADSPHPRLPAAEATTSRGPSVAIIAASIVAALAVIAAAAVIALVVVRRRRQAESDKAMLAAAPVMVVAGSNMSSDHSRGTHSTALTGPPGHAGMPAGPGYEYGHPGSAQTLPGLTTEPSVVARI